MNEIQILQIVNEELGDALIRVDKQLVPRTVTFPDAPNKIKVAIGMRRSGKTYFIYQAILKQLKHKVPLTRILYVNFEDDRLLPLDAYKLAALLEAFYTLHPENHDHKCYLYLDEIQNVPDWANVIRRFHDTKNVEIFLTGSSAKLLSKEIATSLRGRSLATEIWPYSLSEFMVAKKIDAHKSTFGKKTQDQLGKIFQEYLQEGGFPEVVNYPTEIRQRTLQDYIDIVIYRDIVERYDIKHSALIKYMIISMIHNVGKSFTINKFYNDARSQGYQLGKDALYEYANYIEDAYLMFSVPMYAKSIRKVQTNPKKIYAIDSGLVRALTLEPEINVGNLFENIIFIDLRRNDYLIHYYLTKERYEVDFLVQDRQGNKQLIQVTWSMEDKDTFAREERALELAKNELKIPGKIITLESYLREGIGL